MTIGPMRRSHVKEFLGVSDWTLKKIMAADLIGKVFLRRDRRGRPVGRAFYVRADVERVKGQLGGANVS